MGGGQTQGTHGQRETGESRAEPLDGAAIEGKLDARLGRKECAGRSRLPADFHQRGQGIFDIGAIPVAEFPGERPPT